MSGGSNRVSFAVNIVMVLIGFRTLAYQKLAKNKVIERDNHSGLRDFLW
ncbi:hypothetical protein [Endozoicomonas sp.]|nr:hypothetical protein [Endozoicomonas sp.]